MFEFLHRRLQRWLLQEPEYAFLWEPDTTGEVVALDCETTGLNLQVDELMSICAIKIRGNQILASERLELLIKPWVAIDKASIAVHRLRPMDVEAGMEAPDALAKLLHFIGSRPLVGYYLEFDVAMINKYLKIMIGTTLPNKIIEVSGMYFDYRYRHQVYKEIDLRFSTIMEDLDLPDRLQHDAYNDALLAALMYIKLRSLTGRMAPVRHASHHEMGF
jgi:DNA polymerase-3 subunit epsilon